MGRPVIHRPHLKQNIMEIGDRLPEILGKDQDGNEIKLSDFKGKKLVLYAYPKDMTSGCTNQACNLRDNYNTFLNKGYAVVGVSIQDEKSHKNLLRNTNSPSLLLPTPTSNLLRHWAYMARRKCMAVLTWAHSAPHSLQMKMEL